jgi:hypothetical protein
MGKKVVHIEFATGNTVERPCRATPSALLSLGSEDTVSLFQSDESVPMPEGP